MQTILRDQRIPDCLGAQKDSSVNLTVPTDRPESRASTAGVRVLGEANKEPKHG
jgi:hypothetical protein